MPPKVILYSSQTCPWCHKTREYFKEHKIKYKDIDVGKNIKAAMEMVKKSGQQGVPVIEIGKELIIGYDEGRIKKLLKIR